MDSPLFSLIISYGSSMTSDNNNNMAVRWQLRSHIQAKKWLLATCKRNMTDRLQKSAHFISQALFIFFIFLVSLDQNPV